MRIFIKILPVIMIASLLTGCAASRVDNGDVSGLDNSDASQTSADNTQSGAMSRIDTAKINAQLGIAYLEKKNVQRAKQKLLLALQQAPNIPEPWYSMAYFLEATGNFDEARKYYMKSVDVAPERGDVQNNYGTFLCRSGHYQESIKHFSQALLKDPARNLSLLKLAEIDIKLKKFKEARQLLNQFALVSQPTPEYENIIEQLNKVNRNKAG